MRHTPRHFSEAKNRFERETRRLLPVEEVNTSIEVLWTKDSRISNLGLSLM